MLLMQHCVGGLVCITAADGFASIHDNLDRAIVPKFDHPIVFHIGHFEPW